MDGVHGFQLQVCRHETNTTTARDGSALLNDGEDVARRIFEPRDRRPDLAEDALLVDTGVALEPDAARGELIHRRLDVVDREVEDRVGRRGVVRFRIDEGVAITGDM